MKNLFVALMGGLLLASCGGGLRKSIMEPLEMSELKKMMKSDTTFTSFYKEAQEVREWLLESDLRQAKYGDITYKRLKRYEDNSTDTVLINKINKELEDKYETVYPDYTKQLDSIKTYWKNYYAEYSLDSLVRIEFNDLWKEYYSYSGGVKEVNIGFEVTPLKGTIEQLIFRYCMKSKIANDGKMSTFDSHRCLSSSPLSKTKTLYWVADYSDEKILGSRSVSEIKRDYVFLIEVVEVRIDGVNMSEKLGLVPHSVEMEMKYGDDLLGFYDDDIVKELIDPEYKSLMEFTREGYMEYLKKSDPLVFDLWDEMYSIED